MRFASRTSGGWDYIPHAWNDWMHARDGVVLVALPAVDDATALDFDGSPLDPDVPIAMCRVAMLSPTETWLEGIRVDPRVRGRSVATHLQVAELAWAAAHGARVVRYVTGEDNEGSHRLGARHGFTVVGAWRGYVASDAETTDQEQPWVSDEDDRRMLERGRAARRQLLGDLAGLELVVDASNISAATARQLWDVVDRDPTFAMGGRLYEPRPWALQALTPGRFAAHLRRGEVLEGCEAPGAPPLAVAIVGHDAVTTEDPALHLSVLAGQPDAASTLAWMIRERAGAPVRLRLPDPHPPLVDGRPDAWARDGYPARRQTNHLLERGLDDGSSLPAADADGLVVLEDPPTRVAVAPEL